MFKNNRNLLIISLVAIVNALGYAIIIPVLYPYSVKFGLTDFQNGLLFAVFSIGQFLSTPIIGRLSDKYGRKPLLLTSIAGTAFSFFMMAFAPNAIFLFLARALDGITAGNIPVASAVISDTTAPKNRAKGFGIIWGSFGLGFIFGPAIAAFTVGTSITLPFIIAGAVAVLAFIVTLFFLPETNKHIGDVEHKKLFDFGKLFHALVDKNVGPTLLITLFYSWAFAMGIIFGFQPFSLKVLHLSENQIATIFTFMGVIGLITQVFLISRFTKAFGLKKAYQIGILMFSACFLALFFINSFIPFLIFLALLGFSNSTVSPLTQAILSQETDEKSQGTILGLNSSYMSIGQVIGPIVGGTLASFYIPLPFLAGFILGLICFFLSFKVLRPGVRKESAF